MKFTHAKYVIVVPKFAWGRGGGETGVHLTSKTETTGSFPERDLIPRIHKCEEGAERFRVY
jgi:hypothetical protein